MPDQEARRDAEIRHSFDVLVVQNAAMFDSAATCPRIQPQISCPLVGIEGAVDRGISVGVHTDRPALPQPCLDRILKLTHFDVGDALLL